MDASSAVGTNRIPPHNLDAERSVIGAILLTSDVLMDVVDIVKPDDFYSRNHASIYETIIELFNQNLPVDVVTVTERLTTKGILEIVGGIPYIASLADDVPLSSNAKQYATIVAEKSIQRKLIKAAYEISKTAYEPEGDISQALEMAEQLIFGISQNRTGKSYVQLRDVLTTVYNKLEEISQMKGIPGIPTGYHDLDKMLSGLHDSDLILIAARPGMGKTAFMLNIAQYAAINKKVPVAVFNLEMSNEQLATRMLSSVSQVASEKLRSGQIQDDDWTRLAEALGPMSEAPIYFDDATDVSVSSIRAKCRKLKLEKDIKLVIIDYIQLMSGSKRTDNRVQEVSDISRSLKIMAKELNVPVIVGSQLSRDVEKRGDKRPMLSDLRESGAIEQDADIVMFLYRDDYYNPDTEYKNVTEVIVAKHRNGSTGTVKLMFDPEHITFKNMAFSK
ncbi:MAG TPA: replicative DNA helicase [Clostridia bacterium]|nr:replicative DNA helicase [Clostridia bacterium]